jgi:hypothetical protein
MNDRKMNELDVFRHELLFDGVSGEEFAMSIGMSYPSYKNVVRDGSKVVPKWVLAFLFGRGYVYVGGVLVQKKIDAPHKFGSPSYSVKYGTCTISTDNPSEVTYNGSISYGVNTKLRK